MWHLLYWEEFLEARLKLIYLQNFFSKTPWRTPFGIQLQRIGLDLSFFRNNQKSLYTTYTKSALNFQKIFFSQKSNCPKVTDLLLSSFQLVLLHPGWYVLTTTLREPRGKIFIPGKKEFVFCTYIFILYTSSRYNFCDFSILSNFQGKGRCSGWWDVR